MGPFKSSRRLRLPRRRDAEIERGAEGNAGVHATLNAFWTALGLRSMTRR